MSLARLALSLSLPPLPLTVPPAYLPATGAIGAVLGLAFGVGLWTGRRWAYDAAPYLVGALTLWYWGDRLLLARTDYAQRTWPAAALATVVMLALAGYAWSRPSTRRFFGRSQE